MRRITLLLGLCVTTLGLCAGCYGAAAGRVTPVPNGDGAVATAPAGSSNWDGSGSGDLSSQLDDLQSSLNNVQSQLYTDAAP